MKNVILIGIITVYSIVAKAQQCNIIPQPHNIEYAKAIFTLNKEVAIINESPVFVGAYESFINYLKIYVGISLHKMSNLDKKGRQIILKTDNTIKDIDEYSIYMNDQKIVLSANSNEGMNNALHSLLQLIQTSVKQKNNIIIPCWNIIHDRPTLSWRGFMLDESRHFFGKKTIKKILDIMSLYKLNRFHWHLTDETGWRIEIKQYPRLTTIGAVGDFDNKLKAAQYYTQKDVKDIVQYADKLGITVIPEIDMPGHATAANKAYPWFSGGGSDKHPEFTFNPGLDTTYTFLANILKEVMTLFPSKMIHIGGDEVSFGNKKWETDSAIRKLKIQYKLNTSIDVEHYFISRIADSVYKFGGKIIGWDEIADVDLDPSKTIIMWWRHDHPEQVIKSINKGYQLVACPRLPFYFDFVQDAKDKIGRRWNGKYNDLSSVYNFNIDSLVTNISRSQLLGIQACAWTEQISSTNRLNYMIYPRLFALSESAWSYGISRDSYQHFENILSTHLPLWRKLGINYYNFIEPLSTPEVSDIKKAIQYLDNAK